MKIIEAVSNINHKISKTGFQSKNKTPITKKKSDNNDQMSNREFQLLRV